MEERLLACVENLDSDLVCARGFHLDIFELEWLACTPAYGSLALDDFSFSFRHGSSAGGATRPLALRFSPITRPITQISPGSRAVPDVLCQSQYMSFQNIYYKRVSVSRSYVLLQYHGFFPKKKKKS
jgi:hypothetical protein